LEDAGVDLDLFDAGAVELFQGCDDAGFLSCTRRAVDEEMGEVPALSLREVSLDGGEGEGLDAREIANARKGLYDKSIGRETVAGACLQEAPCFR
jgi:hypothetical protein